VRRPTGRPGRTDRPCRVLARNSPATASRSPPTAARPEACRHRRGQRPAAAAHRRGQSAQGAADDARPPVYARPARALARPRALTLPRRRIRGAGRRLPVRRPTLHSAFAPLPRFPPWRKETTPPSASASSKRASISSIASRIAHHDGRHRREMNISPGNSTTISQQGRHHRRALRGVRGTRHAAPRRLWRSPRRRRNLWLLLHLLFGTCGLPLPLPRPRRNRSRSRRIGTRLGVLLRRSEAAMIELCRGMVAADSMRASESESLRSHATWCSFRPTGCRSTG